MKSKKKAQPAAGQDTTLAAQAKAALAQTPAPSVTDPDIVEAVEQNKLKANKRKGRAKTLLGGAYDAPMTAKTVLEMKY